MKCDRHAGAQNLFAQPGDGCGGRPKIGVEMSHMISARVGNKRKRDEKRSSVFGPVVRIWERQEPQPKTSGDQLLWVTKQQIEQSKDKIIFINKFC